MKQTRKIVIKNRVFSLDDLQRIGKVLKKQQDLARKSDHHTDTSFQIEFSDNTSIESDNIDVLSEDFVRRPGRPVQVRFSFHNYTLHRRIEFSLSHGEAEFGNDALISGEEQNWVSENFLALKEAIDSVKPQSFWFRRHPALLLHLIALGIGSLAQFSIDILMTALISHTGLEHVIIPLEPNSPWRVFLQSIVPVLYVLLWVWRWLLGLMCGAFGIRAWLLSLWPNIEFGFGAEHLNIEKTQRARLVAVLSLMVIPIVTSVIYDILKFAF